MANVKMANVKVNNVPDCAKESPYWVARKDEDGELWFWGAWSDKQSADHIAKVMHGVVVENGEE